MSFIPPSLLLNSNNYLYYSSMISANYDKIEGFQPIVKSLYPLLFLYWRISFDFPFGWIREYQDKNRTTTYVHTYIQGVPWWSLWIVHVFEEKCLKKFQICFYFTSSQEDFDYKKIFFLFTLLGQLALKL